MAVTALLMVPPQAAVGRSARFLATTSNPYAGCTIGAVNGSHTYLNAEVEPQVAVNPLNPANVIGVAQQDRWSDGGAHGLVAMVSMTGGTTFTVVPLPFSSCAPGGLNYERASDPWVSFGPDGTAYAVSISFDQSSARSAVAASTSRDGGRTWTSPRILVADDTGPFHDKESVTADSRHPGTAYVVWDVTPPGSDFPAPSLFSKTTDFGRTWSAPTRITQPDPGYGELGNLLLVDPRNGTLYDIFARIYAPNYDDDLFATQSTDGGASWSTPTLIAHDQSVYDFDPHPGGPFLRTAAHSLPEAAIDPVTGRLYVVWEDARFSAFGVNDIVMSTSDGGTAWSSPVVVNRPNGYPAFNPMVAVDLLGEVAITYRDFRTLDLNQPQLPTSTIFRRSSRGGRSFGAEQPLAPPFDLLTAPDAGGKFVGDYDGLTAMGPAFGALYCVTTGIPSNPTDCDFSIAR